MQQRLVHLVEWREKVVSLLRFGGVPDVHGQMRHVVTAAAVVVAAFFPEREILDVADELNDVLALGGIDHLAPHDFLGVVIS